MNVASCVCGAFERGSHTRQDVFSVVGDYYTVVLAVEFEIKRVTCRFACGLSSCPPGGLATSGRRDTSTRPSCTRC